MELTEPLVFDCCLVMKVPDNYPPSRSLDEDEPANVVTDLCSSTHLFEVRAGGDEKIPITYGGAKFPERSKDTLSFHYAREMLERSIFHQ